jgi:hypothetical protein
LEHRGPQDVRKGPELRNRERRDLLISLDVSRQEREVEHHVARLDEGAREDVEAHAALRDTRRELREAAHETERKFIRHLPRRSADQVVIVQEPLGRLRERPVAVGARLQVLPCFFERACEVPLDEVRAPPRGPPQLALRLGDGVRMGMRVRRRSGDRLCHHFRSGRHRRLPQPCKKTAAPPDPTWGAIAGRPAGRRHRIARRHGRRGRHCVRKMRSAMVRVPIQHTLCLGPPPRPRGPSNRCALRPNA